MRIKTLRASGSRIQADVVVGANKYGSDVTVHVEVNRKEPEVEQALERLTSLLSTRAQALVDDAAVEARVVQQVSERTAEARKAAVLAGDRRVLTFAEEVERLVGDRPGPLETWQVQRLQKAVADAKAGAEKKLAASA